MSDRFFLSQMKFKNKISYLGKKISILPKKMTEKMEVEVDVKSGGKNVKNRFFKMHFMTTSKNVRQNFFVSNEI